MTQRFGNAEKDPSSPQTRLPQGAQCMLSLEGTRGPAIGRDDQKTRKPRHRGSSLLRLNGEDENSDVPMLLFVRLRELVWKQEQRSGPENISFAGISGVALQGPILKPCLCPPLQEIARKRVLIISEPSLLTPSKLRLQHPRRHARRCQYPWALARSRVRETVIYSACHCC
jgi:hypothetical protein